MDEMRTYFKEAKKLVYAYKMGAEFNVQQNIALGNHSYDGRYLVVDMEWMFSQAEIPIKERMKSKTRIDLVIVDTVPNDKGFNDIFIHTGDITEDGTEEEVKDFVEWLCDLPYRQKIFIAGNHDLCLCDAKIEGLPDDVHYLSNESVTIDGFKFYGVPMFVEDELDGTLTELYSRIPDDTDVLLTHQPPLGILDELEGINYGDYSLYKRVMDVKPRYHLFGHVHDVEKTSEVFRKIWFSNGACRKQGLCYYLNNGKISVS